MRAYGFAYLNSDHCSKLLSQLHEATLTTIAELGDHRLAEHYNLRQNTNELRDKAMMTNIENYCRTTSFSIGAFLVGAAHRQSIIALSRNRPGADSFAIQWDFSGFLEAPHRASGE